MCENPAPVPYQQRPHDIYERVIRYEEGDLTVDETAQLFSDLIRFGVISGLQGSYGRTAERLIEGGVLDPTTFRVNPGTAGVYYEELYG